MTNRDTEIACRSVIARTAAFSARRVKLMLEKLGSAEAILTAGPERLRRLSARDSAPEWFLESRRRYRPAEEFERLQEEGLIALIPEDPAYPELLRQIPDGPFVLYVRGETKILDCDGRARLGLSVVGTRKMTRYGQAATDMLVGPLAQAGAVIVSGLALGTDAAAHQAALEAGGLTVAVLGGGIDGPTITPKRHRQLADRIAAEGGAVISEYPPGFEPDRTTFPLRNRIIAGLSVGTVVTEAAEKSGALITAAAALEYNRDVWAVPGQIDRPLSVGTNRLLTNGALPAVSAQAIMEHYRLSGQVAFPIESVTPDQMSPEAKSLLKILKSEPLSADDLIEKTNLSASQILTALSNLEISELVSRQGTVYGLRR